MLRKMIVITSLLLCAATVSGQDVNDMQRLRNENVRLRIQVRELQEQLDRMKASGAAGLSTLDDFDVNDDDNGIVDLFSVIDNWDDLVTVSDYELPDEPQTIDDFDRILRIPHDNVFHKYMDVYLIQRRDMTLRAFARFGKMEMEIREVFRQYGIPEEFSVLCIVESAANSRARSKAGALGLWQLMPATARDYGLTVTTTRDDRFDPVKSTKAAAKHISRLYRVFGDWALTFMAYNCGEGALQKAIAANGGKTDCESLFKKVPRETRDYLPALLSIMYINSKQDLLYEN